MCIDFGLLIPLVHRFWLVGVLGCIDIIGVLVHHNMGCCLCGLRLSTKMKTYLHMMFMFMLKEA